MDCCKDCASRNEGCHDRCVKYIAQFLVSQEKLEVVSKHKQKEKDFYSHKQRVWERVKKRGKK